ncbi:MAG: hypothetical protein ABII27_01980 [bacterium]
MKIAQYVFFAGVCLTCITTLIRITAAQNSYNFSLELEAGPVWQSRNTIEIPNDGTGTSFSLTDSAGSGPWSAGRLTLLCKLNRSHSLGILAAPLSYTETVVFPNNVRFAGKNYNAQIPAEATYKFNSWRASYRYLFLTDARWRLWVGFTAKIRDARIALKQGSTSSKKTDLGFVPLLYFATDYHYATRWHLLFDVDALGGGPGRAIDSSLKLKYDITNRWGVATGYRIVEGGADTEEVYNFALFQYAFISTIYHF